MSICLVTLDTSFAPLGSLPSPVISHDVRPVHWLPTTRKTHRVCVFVEEHRNEFQTILQSISKSRTSVSHFYHLESELEDLDCALRRQFGLTIDTTLAESVPEVSPEPPPPVPVVSSPENEEEEEDLGSEEEVSDG